MTHPKDIDPARLAALIDGRLSDADAAALRTQLAESDDDTLAAFADAVAVAGEIARPHSTLDASIPAPVSLHRRRRWLLPAFASAAAIATVTFLSLRTGSRTEAYQPAMLAAALPSTLEVPDSPPWSVTRGPGSTLSPRVQAIRTGILVTDIELGLIRADTSTRASNALAALLDGVRGLDSLAAAMRGASLSTGDRQALLDRAMLAVDPTLARAASYLEAARLATSAGDTTFLERFPPSGIDSAKRSPLLDDASRSAIRTTLDALAHRPRSASAVHALLEKLLQVLVQ